LHRIHTHRVHTLLSDEHQDRTDVDGKAHVPGDYADHATFAGGQFESGMLVMCKQGHRCTHVQPLLLSNVHLKDVDVVCPNGENSFVDAGFHECVRVFCLDGFVQTYWYYHNVPFASMLDADRCTLPPSTSTSSRSLARSGGVGRRHVQASTPTGGVGRRHVQASTPTAARCTRNASKQQHAASKQAAARRKARSRRTD
jgi:hypothetical protein